jgi:hypothetical protein
MSKIKINMDSLKARREWKRHKVKDGQNVFRILPPFGENSNNYPYRKWQIIWGLKDPDSGRVRPFASSLTSEKKCPVFEYVQELKKKAETLKAKLASSGVSEEAAKERINALNKLIQDLSPKTVYIYNAVDKSGEVGLLELKTTAHKQMKNEMALYIKDYNQDPTSLNSSDEDSGVWFNIIRSGLGRDTEYTVKRVSIKTKNQDTGKISFEDDRSPLPESIVEGYDDMAYDLSSVYQVKTYEELEQILHANLEEILSICPDADLNLNASFEANVLKNTTVAPVKTQGMAKVNVRLDDEDEEEVDLSANFSTKSKSSSFNDDDFLAEADALLNS